MNMHSSFSPTHHNFLMTCRQPYVKMPIISTLIFQAAWTVLFYENCKKDAIMSILIEIECQWKANSVSLYTNTYFYVGEFEYFGNENSFRTKKNLNKLHN